MKFPIIKVNESYQIEQLGTKSKFWFYKEVDAENKPLLKYLCKIGRDGTGENWAEKFSSEFAKFLQIPCVDYDLAETKDGIQSVVCPSIVNNGGSLIHANELLSKVFEEYPEANAFQMRQYKLNTALACLKKFQSFITPPVGYNSTLGIDTNSIIEVFISYLMLDCLIGNQDRHDENWGIVVNMESSLDVKAYLAPTYDHASSLACRLNDNERKERLTSKDHGYRVSKFVQKAKTPFYDTDGNNRLKTLDCLNQAVINSKSGLFAKKCIETIGSITQENIELIFNNFPDNYLSDVEIEFTMLLIMENRERILGLRGGF